LHGQAEGLGDASEYLERIFCGGMDASPQAKDAMGRNRLQEFNVGFDSYIPAQKVPNIIKK
jgi:hypothetical protein